MKLLKLEERQYSVFAVCDDRGAASLLNFLENLGANYDSSRNGMLNLLERCATAGPPKNSELKHHLGDGIYELIKGQLRVLFFHDKGKVIICTHGFVKKSRKVPEKEITAAQRARQAYLAAKKGGALEILEGDEDD